MSSGRAASAIASRRVKEKLIRLLFAPGGSPQKVGASTQRTFEQSTYSYEQLRVAYLQRVHEIHPDKAVNVQESKRLFVELQDAWTEYDSTTKMYRQSASGQDGAEGDFIMFGVGCSFSDNEEEKQMRSEIMDQAGRGWFSAGSIAAQSSDNLNASLRHTTPLFTLMEGEHQNKERHYHSEDKERLDQCRGRGHQFQSSLVTDHPSYRKRKAAHPGTARRRCMRRLAFLDVLGRTMGGWDYLMMTWVRQVCRHFVTRFLDESLPNPSWFILMARWLEQAGLLRNKVCSALFITTMRSRVMVLQTFRFAKRYARRCSRPSSTLGDILRLVSEQKLDAAQAERMISEQWQTKHNLNDDALIGFANLDHERAMRTGFPEAVFAQGKTAEQVSLILDDMARHANERSQSSEKGSRSSPILATRVTAEKYKEMLEFPLKHGTMEYHDVARIVAVKASGSQLQRQISSEPATTPVGRRVVVATAGTTDLYAAEEAAVTLEAAGCRVDRVYDAGVAGLHRIVRALPRLRHAEVGAVVVCAGMDGALPSVIGGLVSVPVVAVPTSVGYGAAFGGVSALLTMLNSCSPGVGVVNIDNGFGAAALVYKMLK